jgi:hypothetical protein
MPTERSERLKSAFSSYRRPEDADAERKLLGRTVDEDEAANVNVASPQDATTSISHEAIPRQPAAALSSQYLSPTYQLPTTPSGLHPRPKTVIEPTTQMSFRVPLSLARLFRRKAKYNQLEQQEIIAEVLKRAVAELPDPPPDWND